MSEHLVASTAFHTVAQLLVLVVQIPGVLFGGMQADGKPWMQCGKLCHGRPMDRMQRLDCGAAGIDECTVAEHLGEPFRHASCALYGGAVACQVRSGSPHRPSGVFDNLAKVVQHILSDGSQLVHAVRFAQHVIGNVVAFAVAEVSGTMSPVVADIERLFAARRPVSSGVVCCQDRCNSWVAEKLRFFVMKSNVFCAAHMTG